MQVTLAERLHLNSDGTGVPGPSEFSSSSYIGETNAVQVETVIFFNNLALATSLTVRLQGSNDDENWKNRGSSLTYGSEEVGRKVIKVADIADQYVRLKYTVGIDEAVQGDIVLAADIHHADL